MINTLQQLVPDRQLQRSEAFTIAEIQAQKLRRLLNVTGALITDQHLRAIPGLVIEAVANLGVSGAARKAGGQWIVLINRDESNVRQRFTIGHEIKHILDDKALKRTSKIFHQTGTSAWFTEQICDYFAACLLMPRTWVKRAWTARTQHVVELAEFFDVSTSAARIRLQQIGLTDLQPRPLKHPNVVPLATRNIR